MVPHTLYQTLHANGTSRFVSDTPSAWYLTLGIRYSIRRVPHALYQTLQPRGTSRFVSAIPSKWYLTLWNRHSIEWYRSRCTLYPNGTSCLVSDTLSNGTSHFVLSIHPMIPHSLYQALLLKVGPTLLSVTHTIHMVPHTPYQAIHQMVPHAL